MNFMYHIIVAGWTQIRAYFEQSRLVKTFDAAKIFFSLIIWWGQNIFSLLFDEAKFWNKKLNLSIWYIVTSEDILGKTLSHFIQDIEEHRTQSLK